ncbi:MAG: hypothetical protein JXA58_07665 [Dehalococcoidia bacterium]|nr:hypothetical protein [Dehalococcoidia bacterium]
MKTWKPTAAGVLEIVAGTLHIVAGAATILVAGGIAGGLHFAELPEFALRVPLPLMAGVGLPLLVLGTVSVLGGISALNRRYWGLALAGGICALLPIQTLLGVLAIVFVAISRDEFR